MEIKITLQPKQRESLRVSEVTPVTLFGGAKGGGKSYSIRAREIVRRLKYPNSRGLIVRKTYPELLANHIQPFFTEYPIVRSWYNKAEKTIYWPNGSTTVFSYLQSTDDVYTYQGREFEDITIDEITQHEEEVFKILRSSNRTTNPFIKPRIYLTGNPGGTGHQWVKRIFIDRDFTPNENPEDFAFVQAFVRDNFALMSADPGYVKRLEDLPDHLRKAYLEGDWDIFAGQFFPEFRRHIHGINPFIPKKGLTLVGGMDWGRKAPFSFHLSVLKPVKWEGTVFHRLFTFLEVYGTEKSPSEWASEIKKSMAFYGLTPSMISNIWGDPAMFTKGLDNSLSIADQFSREGIRMQPASNDRKGRWVVAHNWLRIAPDGLPYNLITTNCSNLIRTIPLMQHDERDLEDLDTTLEDHAVDGWSYKLKHLKWIDAGPSGGVGGTVAQMRGRRSMRELSNGKLTSGFTTSDFEIDAPNDKGVHYLQ